MKRGWLCALIISCAILSPRLSAQSQSNAPALPQQVAINGVEFVLIPAGKFWYTVETGARFNYLPAGSPEYRHIQINLPDFYIAKFEAKATDLARFLNAPETSAADRQHYLQRWFSQPDATDAVSAGCTLEHDEQGVFAAYSSSANLPATFLSWQLADKFVRWMGFRLPTETEWQKAARGTDQRLWPWGDNYPADTKAHYHLSWRCSPGLVDSLPSGRSPYGLYHMSGNVSEYVQDWYNEHRDKALQPGEYNPPLATTGSDIAHEQHKKITKGGSWSQNAAGITIGHRRLATPQRAFSDNGVRFAIDAEEVENLLKINKAHALTTETGSFDPS